MIPATQKKLREAQYFLARLEEQARTRVDLKNSEYAEFYFSAFVSAGRSVTFALQSESKDKYDAWFPEWLRGLSESEKLAFDRFKEERNQSEKRSGSSLRSVETLTPAARALPAVITVGNRSFFAAGYDVHYGTAGLVCKFAFDGVELSAETAAVEYCKVLAKLVSDFVRESRIAV